MCRARQADSLLAPGTQKTPRGSRKGRSTRRLVDGDWNWRDWLERLEKAGGRDASGFVFGPMERPARENRSRSEAGSIPYRALEVLRTRYLVLRPAGVVASAN